MANIFDSKNNQTPTKLPAEQILELLQEIKCAEQSGVLHIEQRSPSQNFIQFCLTDVAQEKKTLVCESLAARYPGLHFMWHDISEKKFVCVVYYFVDSNWSK